MLPEPHSNSHQPLLGNRVYMWRLSFLVILNALTSKLGSRNAAAMRDSLLLIRRRYLAIDITLISRAYPMRQPSNR